MATTKPRNYGNMLQSTLATTSGLAQPKKSSFLAELHHSPKRAVAAGGYELYSSEEDYPVGARVKLPVGLAAEDPLQPRAFMDALELAGLSEDLEANGQLEAIQVYPKNAEGLFVVRSGHRRLRVLGEKGASHILAEIVAPAADPKDAYLKARAINLQHKSHNYLDDAIRFPQLLEAGVFNSQKDLAESLGLTSADVSRRLKVGELPRSVFEYLKSHKDAIGISAAYSVYLYWEKSKKDDEACLGVCRELYEGSLTVRALEERLQRLSLEGPTTESSPAEKKTRSRTLSVSTFSGVCDGSLKVFNTRMVLSLGGLSVDTRGAIYEKVMAVLKESGVSVNEELPQSN